MYLLIIAPPPKIHLLGTSEVATLTPGRSLVSQQSRSWSHSSLESERRSWTTRICHLTLPALLLSLYSIVFAPLSHPLPYFLPRVLYRGGRDIPLTYSPPLDFLPFSRIINVHNYVNVGKMDSPTHHLPPPWQKNPCINHCFPFHTCLLVCFSPSLFYIDSLLPSPPLPPPPSLPSVFRVIRLWRVTWKHCLECSIQKSPPVPSKTISSEISAHGQCIASFPAPPPPPPRCNNFDLWTHLSFVQVQGQRSNNIGKGRERGSTARASQCTRVYM